MESLLSVGAGTAAVSATAILYFLNRSVKPLTFKFNNYTGAQSSVVDESEQVHVSHPMIPDKLLFDNITTTYELFLHGMEKSPDQLCFGTRSNISESYQWSTFQEVNQKILNCSIAIRLLGGGDPKFVGILSKNCPEWLIVEFACSASGYAVVPLYETFGTEACRHILEETGLQLVVCGTVTQANSLISIASPTVRYVIIIEADTDTCKSLETMESSINILSFTDFLEVGSQKPSLPVVLDPDSLFMICYTSGSTGFPKGVMITHTQLLTTLKAVFVRLEDERMAENAVHICYLPLPHILEQLASLVTFLFGGRIGFLTTDIAGLLNDMQALRPTALFTVPRVLSRIYTSAMQKIANYPLFGRFMKHAITKRMAEHQKGLFHQNTLIDWLFFRKVRNMLGGRIRLVVWGGAPAADEVVDFIRAALSCPVVTAYGMTETCGLISLTYFGDLYGRYVGALQPGLQAKLMDVPDMDIVVSDGGVGEVCVKGAHCTKGYFRNEAMTARLIDADGWLHTGDLGSWHSNGALEIVGRSKAAFKLAQGEYVSPERLEEIYQLCNLVSQVFVDGNSLYQYAIAVVVPNLEKLHEALKDRPEAERGFLTNGHASNHSNGNVGSSKPTTRLDVCNNPEIEKLVLEKMNEVGTQHNLKGFEKVKSIHLTKEPFTIDNQLLTANLKLSRGNLRRHFSTVIDQLYLNAQAQRI